MISDRDLSESISTHPRPFQDQAQRSSVDFASPRFLSSDTAVQGGTSTSVEPITPPDEPRLDPIRRYVQHDSNEDIELQRLPQYNAQNDPFALSGRMKTTSELSGIRANMSRKRAGSVSLPRAQDAIKAKKLQGFYEAQNQNIERLLKPVDEHRREAKGRHEDNQLRLKIAINSSFIANVLLAALQLYGAISSGSLSLFTTTADALFDPLSNVMLILSNRAINRVDPRHFPSGKARIETAGNIVFCFLMCSVSFILIVLSARDIAAGSLALTEGFHLPSVIAVSIAICTKFALFVYCFALRNHYSQIRILWEDHRNDLIINGFGLLTSVGGSKLRWWVDPMGAIVLSCLISFLWLRTAWSQFQLLIGVSADTNTLQLITYISMTHSPVHVLALDTVRAWHSGPRLIVEVDVVMDPSRSLKETHDVAEELQVKLESLPNVERAYVHVDYETSHAPEHFWKKEL